VLFRSHGKARAFSIATDVLAATALAGAGVSIYLTVRARRAGDETAPVSAKPAARLVILPGGLGVAGTF